MKVIRFIFKLIYSIGFIIILVMGSYSLASIFYYNHKVNEEKVNVNIISENDKIVGFFAENKDYVNIDLKLKYKLNNQELINFAYDYFEQYKCPIYLYDFTFPESIVTIDINGNASIYNT